SRKAGWSRSAPTSDGHRTISRLIDCASSHHSVAGMVYVSESRKDALGCAASNASASATRAIFNRSSSLRALSTERLPHARRGRPRHCRPDRRSGGAPGSPDLRLQLLCDDVHSSQLLVESRLHQRMIVIVGRNAVLHLPLVKVAEPGDVVRVAAPCMATSASDLPV